MQNRTICNDSVIPTEIVQAIDTIEKNTHPPHTHARKKKQKTMSGSG